MAIIDKIAFICINKGKVLVARSRGKELFYFPGGKREVGETDEQTLLREVMEELSVEIKAETITYFGTFCAQADDKIQGVTVQMRCYFAEFTGNIIPNNEIAELKWITMAEVTEVSVVSQQILGELSKNEYL